MDYQAFFQDQESVDKLILGVILLLSTIFWVWVSTLETGDYDEIG